MLKCEALCGTVWVIQRDSSTGKQSKTDKAGGQQNNQRETQMTFINNEQE